MCNAKPGTRCSRHARLSLASARRRYSTAADAYEQKRQAGAFEQAPRKEARAKDRVATAQANLIRATLDNDSTMSGLADLKQKIARAQREGSDTRALEMRRDAAITLRKCRSEYAKVMPSDQPVSRDAAIARERLGTAYSNLAHTKAQMRLHTTPPEHLTRAAEAAEREAFQHDVAYRFAQHRGDPDSTHLTPVETKLYRAAADPDRRSLSMLSHFRAATRDSGHERFTTEVAKYETGVHESLGLTRTPQEAPHDTAPILDSSRPHPDGSPERANRQEQRKSVRRSGSSRSRQGVRRALDRAEQALDQELDTTPGTRQTGPGLLADLEV